MLFLPTAVVLRLVKSKPNCRRLTFRVFTHRCTGRARPSLAVPIADATHMCERRGVNHDRSLNLWPP